MKVYQVAEAILYRLKTDCQWRQLPLKQYFRIKYPWQGVYYHFQKWCKDGSFGKIWQLLLDKYKHLPDFQKYCFKNDIVENIDQNKRNGILQEHLLDELLNKCRIVVERTKACFDAFKDILVRYKTNSTHWKALNLLAFTIIISLNFKQLHIKNTK